ncbi:MAG: hypothetical protein L0Z50_36230, partial [Verrucomicrobiales bacterium]|nr:hypothetical protein [Verrucomicrobiales bacterium]
NALVKLKKARDLDPDNWRIRKQIWTIEHPEKFYTQDSPDFGWQKEELAQKRARRRSRLKPHPCSWKWGAQAAVLRYAVVRRALPPSILLSPLGGRKDRGCWNCGSADGSLARKSARGRRRKSPTSTLYAK